MSSLFLRRQNHIRSFTIISRCQRFDFTRLTDQEMVQRMQYVLKEEGKTYDDGSQN